MRFFNYTKIISFQDFTYKYRVTITDQSHHPSTAITVNNHPVFLGIHVENEPVDLQVADVGLRERCFNNDDYRVENDLAPESIDKRWIESNSFLGHFCFIEVTNQSSLL